MIVVFFTYVRKCLLFHTWLRGEGGKGVVVRVGKGFGHKIAALYDG